MMPVPPLDGGRVVYSLLPTKQANTYAKLEAYGLIIMLVLLLTGVMHFILEPIIAFTIMMLPASDIVANLIPVILSPARS
jgi:Zn-dependent protease